MDRSSPRFRSLIVTAGLSFWFFIIGTSTGYFSLELFTIFVISILIITQVFSSKISKGLDILAIVNTKIFLGALFITVISIYGIMFKFLRIDLLRLRKQKDTYWLEIEETEQRIRKQY